jgi:hypothetical protein
MRDHVRHIGQYALICCDASRLGFSNLDSAENKNHEGLFNIPDLWDFYNMTNKKSTARAELNNTWEQRSYDSDTRWKTTPDSWLTWATILSHPPRIKLGSRWSEQRNVENGRKVLSQSPHLLVKPRKERIVTSPESKWSRSLGRIHLAPVMLGTRMEIQTKRR